MTRTDIHRPSAINPCDYDFVAMDYYGPADFGDSYLASHRQAFREHMARTGGTFSQHNHAGSCHICGAAAMYVAKFHHLPTNTYIVTGTDCADNMEMGNPEAFKRFRKGCIEHGKTAKAKAAAKLFLEQAGVAIAWDIYAATERSAFQNEESIITDIVGKLVKYGSVSEKQVAFVQKLVGLIAARAERTVQRAAETAAAAPLPAFTGRVRIEGTVLSTKTVEGAYGTQFKMLVQHADGWKVWGTIPSSIEVARGDRVAFEAKVEASQDDAKFGFFSRPTKAQVIR
jgi:hypothetical protein